MVVACGTRMGLCATGSGSASIRRLSSRDADLMYASARVPSPADAVARLVRGAVDAGATRVEVVADRGGAWVRVADDAGRGSAGDVAELAVLGAVARVDVWTRAGGHVVLGGGEADAGPLGGWKGRSIDAEWQGRGGEGSGSREGGWRQTVVEASSFYARQPVRRKLVRAEAAGGRMVGAVRARVVREALGAPEVGFVVRDSSAPWAPVVLLKAGQLPEARLRACFGAAAVAALAPVDSSRAKNPRGVHVQGHASRISASAEAAGLTAPVQLLYVGGRCVEVRTEAHRALDRVFARAQAAAANGQRTARHPKPSYVLHVRLDGGMPGATDVALGALRWEPILEALADALREPWGLPPGPLGALPISAPVPVPVPVTDATPFSGFACPAAPQGVSRVIRPRGAVLKRRPSDEDDAQAAAQGLRAYFRVKRRHLGEERAEGEECEGNGATYVPPLLDSTSCWARWAGTTRLEKADVERLALVGQAADQVLVARLPPRERGRGPRLVAVDQHAADERVRLDTLTRKWRAERGEKGDLLRAAEPLESPLELALGPEERELARRYRGHLAGWGFTVEEDTRGVGQHSSTGAAGGACADGAIPASAGGEKSSSRFLLTSCPRVEGTPLSAGDCVAFLRALGETLGNADPPALLRELQRAACRGAVMFGDTLGAREGAALLRRLACADLPFQCAHGRPTLAPLADLSQPPKAVRGCPWRNDLAPERSAVLRLARGPPDGPPSPEPSQGSAHVEPLDIDRREERAMMRYLADVMNK